MPRRALTAVLILAAAAVLSFRPIYEPDLWWHLAQGRENVAGHIVRTNVFSFTYPDYRQQYTPWLFDASAYLAWRAAGPVGIQLLQLTFVALAMGLLYAACRVRAPAWSAAAVLMVGFYILEPRAIPRPHLVSFAGMAACILLVERAAQQRSARPLALAVPIVALWSNLHVECVFGVALVAIFAIGETVWPSALDRREGLRATGIALLCGLAIMANPYGWGLIAYLYENLSVPAIMAIAELRPPYLPAYRAFYAYLIVGGLLIAILPRRLRLWEVAAAVAFGVLGAMHLRLTPLVLFATAPIVASRLAVVTARYVDPRAVLVTVFCAALALSRIPIPLLVRGFEVGADAVEPQPFFSRAAVEFVTTAGLDGPVFNSHNLGGYLAWMLYPSVRVFQDSRLQAYPPEHFLGIMQAYRSQRDWDALVANVDWAVLSIPRPNQLSGEGRFPIAHWAVVFQDDAMEILVRRTGRYSRLAQR